MDPSFQKEFLRDFQQKNSGPVLAFFGKHPAWDDHMDDLGLSTPSLRTCKKLIYLNGIAANAARQQSTTADVAPYRHLLLWIRDQEAILIRLVESEDGRGRGYFPLVGAVHFQAASMPSTLGFLIPLLSNLVTRVRGLTGRRDVEEQFQQARIRLEHDSRNPSPIEPPDPAGTAEVEAEAIRSALVTPGAFVRLRLPVTRYDCAQTLAALAAACPRGSGPVLISQGDHDPFSTICQGHPERTDFWFIRETQGV